MVAQPRHNPQRSSLISTGKQLTPLEKENDEIINHSKIQLKLKRDSTANLL